MILETIAQANRERYAEIEKQVPLEEIKSKALSMKITDEFPFEKALAKDGISYICEVKKASPSKGIIAEDFPYVQIAKDYENAGASAISVLTEPQWFKGENKYLQEISQNVKIPLLRKDFTVCEYQIYEAKVIGASAVLLICALLDTETIRKWIKICDSLGLSALVEAHTEEEVKSALEAGARVIGVNNRNLKDFTVDLTTCTRLRKLVPKEILFVGESGIKTAEDVQELREAGVNGLLIGETLMRNADKKKALEELNGAEIFNETYKNCSLSELRENIDEIDDKIIELIAKRGKFVKQAAILKKDEDAVKSPDRVNDVIAKARKKAEKYGASADIVEAVYREMISQFINSEMKEFRKQNQ